MNQQRWTRIIGDGLAFSGPCLLTHIIFWPHASTQHTDIYDGRDTTSGKKFCRMDTQTQTTRHISLGPGVRFDAGIYVDTEHREDETTVVFIPLEN